MRKGNFVNWKSVDRFFCIFLSLRLIDIEQVLNTHTYNNFLLLCLIHAWKSQILWVNLGQAQYACHIFVDSCLHCSKWYCSVARVHQSTIGMHTLINSNEFECNGTSPGPLERKQGSIRNGRHWWVFPPSASPSTHFIELIVKQCFCFSFPFFLERFLVRDVHIKYVNEVKIYCLLQITLK